MGEDRWRDMGKEFLSSMCKVRIEELTGFSQRDQRLEARGKQGIPDRENGVQRHEFPKPHWLAPVLNDVFQVSGKMGKKQATSETFIFYFN